MIETRRKQIPVRFRSANLDPLKIDKATIDEAYWQIAGN